MRFADASDRRYGATAAFDIKRATPNYYPTVNEIVRAAVNVSRA